MISPLFSSLIKDDKTKVTTWFINYGISLSAIIQIFSSLLFIFKYNNRWIKFILTTISFFGFVFFFLNFGRGLSIGVKTQLGWGVYFTFLGIILMCGLSIVELMKDSQYIKKDF